MGILRDKNDEIVRNYETWRSGDKSEIFYARLRNRIAQNQYTPHEIIAQLIEDFPTPAMFQNIAKNRKAGSENLRRIYELVQESAPLSFNPVNSSIEHQQLQTLLWLASNPQTPTDILAELQLDAMNFAQSEEDEANENLRFNRFMVLVSVSRNSATSSQTLALIAEALLEKPYAYMNIDGIGAIVDVLLLNKHTPVEVLERISKIVSSKKSGKFKNVDLTKLALNPTTNQETLLRAFKVYEEDLYKMGIKSRQSQYEPTDLYFLRHKNTTFNLWEKIIRRAYTDAKDSFTRFPAMPFGSMNFNRLAYVIEHGCNRYTSTEQLQLAWDKLWEYRETVDGNNGYIIKTMKTILSLDKFPKEIGISIVDATDGSWAKEIREAAYKNRKVKQHYVHELAKASNLLIRDTPAEWVKEMVI